MADQAPGPILPRFLTLAAAELVAKAAAFAVMVLVAHCHGSTGMGQISLATAVTTGVMALATFGLDVWGVRQLARTPELAGALSTTIVLLRLALAVVLYLALIVAALLIEPLRAILAVLLICGLSLFTRSLSLAWIAEGLQRTPVLALANLGCQVLALALACPLLLWAGELWLVPAALVAGEAVVALGLWFWARGSWLQAPLPVRSWPTILRQSGSIGLARLIRVVTQASDLVLLGMLVSMEELGWYSGAYRLYLLSLSLGSLYFVAWFPRAVQAARHSTDRFRQTLVHSVRVGAPAVLTAVVIGVLASGDLLEVLYGSAFRAGTASLQVLWLALAATFLAVHCRQRLLALGEQRANLVLVSSACVVHLAAKLLLIPLAGILGAALGTLIGECLLACLSLRQARRAGAVPASIDAVGRAA